MNKDLVEKTYKHEVRLFGWRFKYERRTRAKLEYR